MYREFLHQQFLQHHLTYAVPKGYFTYVWEQRKLKNFLTESRIVGTKGDVAQKITVKLWGKGVVKKNEVHQGSKATQYFQRKTGQFIYGKLDFLHAAFGIVPEQLNNFESTLDTPAFNVQGLNSIFLLGFVLRKKFYLYQGSLANGTRKAKRIHADVFLEMPIEFPSINEQQSIENLTISLNSLIAANQSKHFCYKMNNLNVGLKYK